jgi:hypothetical protein
MSCCGYSNNKKKQMQEMDFRVSPHTQELYCKDCSSPSDYTSEGNYYQGQSWLPPIPRTAYDKKFMAKYNALAKQTDYSLLNLWEPYVKKN